MKKTFNNNKKFWFFYFGVFFFLQNKNKSLSVYMLLLETIFHFWFRPCFVVAWIEKNKTLSMPNKQELNN